jgi:hypothetical protein
MNTTTGIVGPLFGRNKRRFSMLAAPCWNLLIFPIFRPAEASARQIGHLRVLKLRISDLRLIKLPKTEGFITTRSVSEGFWGKTVRTQTLNPSLTRFEVARFRTAEDQGGENTGDYHNPTRQRGISRNPA